MKKGEQAYVFYGNRSNQYLMLHYDFTFMDNKYDSYRIELRLDFDIYDPKQSKDMKQFIRSILNYEASTAKKIDNMLGLFLEGWSYREDNFFETISNITTKLFGPEKYELDI